MEEMKTFECSICGKKYNNLKDRINCETKCLEEQEKLKKMQEEDTKNKAKKDFEDKIEAEVDALCEQYNKVNKMIKDYYNQYCKQSTYNNLETFYNLLDCFF